MNLPLPGTEKTPMLLTAVTLAWDAGAPKAAVTCRSENPALPVLQLFRREQRHRSIGLSCVVRGEDLCIEALDALRARGPRLAMTAHHLGPWMYSAGPATSAGPLVIDVGPRAPDARGWPGQGLFGGSYVAGVAMPWRVVLSPNTATLLTPDRVRRWARIVEPS